MGSIAITFVTFIDDRTSICPSLSVIKLVSKEYLHVHTCTSYEIIHYFKGLECFLFYEKVKCQLVQVICFSCSTEKCIVYFSSFKISELTIKCVRLGR